MNLKNHLSEELLREALFLSMEDEDLERRLSQLEELLKDLNSDESEEEV